MIGTDGEANLRIRPVFEVIRIDDRDVLLRSPERGVRVRVDGMSAAALAQFLEGLDGTRSLEALVRDRPEREGLAALLRGLLARDVVDADGSDPSSDEARFFGNFHDDPRGCVRRLTESRVVVCGTDPLAGLVSRGLQLAGVGRISTIDVTSGDAVDRVDRPTFAAAFGAADLLVLCPGSVDGHAESVANALAIEIGTPWLLVRIFGAEGFVGPLFMPEEGPCHTCLIGREEANWADRELTRAYLDRLAQHPASLAAYGRWHPMLAVVSDWAVAEATKYLARFTTPALFGTMLRIDLGRCRTQLHRILRLPRCASCSPAARRPTVDGLRYGREQ